MVALSPYRWPSLAGVTEQAWNFKVSSYPILYRQLRPRNGEPLTGGSGAALLRDALDVAWRIEKLLYLFGQADAVLVLALASPLTLAELGLHASADAIVIEDDDAPV